MNIREMSLASLFAAITCALSIIQFPLPFTPVPITLQVLGVVIAGAILGAKLGFISQLTYLFIGLIGVPVYSNFTSGPGKLFGPTGGYIFGFVVAAYLIGFIIDKIVIEKYFSIAQYLLILFSMLLGVFIIYTLGFLQLMMVLNITLKESIVIGVLPFIIGDLIKVAFGSVIAFYVRHALKKSNLI